MLIPTSIKIGPLVYTVQHSHRAVVEFSKTDGTDVYGCCQHRICNILIDEGYPKCREQCTLLHEVLHAIQCVYNLSDLNLKKDSEHYIDLMSTALLSVLQDNPALVAYLAEK